MASDVRVGAHGHRWKHRLFDQLPLWNRLLLLGCRLLEHLPGPADARGLLPLRRSQRPDVSARANVAVGQSSAWQVPW